MSTDEQRLLVRLEANSQKLIKEMAKASDEVRRRVAEIDGSVVNSNKRVTERLTQSAQAFQKTGQASGKMGFAVQNASYQIGDFAVQVAGGTAASRAFAQQLPQLLGGFGVVGAVAGAVAAIAVPLAANFFAAGEELKKIDAISLDAVKSRLSELTELQNQYREAVRISAFTQDETSDRAVEAIGRELEAKKVLFRFEIAQLNQRKAQLEKSLADQQAIVSKLRDDMLMSGDPDGAVSGFVRTRAQSEQLALVQQIIAANQDLFMEIDKQGAELDIVNLSIAAAQALIGGATSAAAGLSGGLGGAADQAARLAYNMSLAQNSRLEYGKILNAGDSGPDAARRSTQWAGQPVAPPTPSAPKLRGLGGGGGSRGSGGGSRGGGGAASDPKAFLQERLDAAQMAAEAAKMEAQAILLGGDAAATAKVKFELLQEAKRKNLDLDQRSAKSGMTLREEIDRQAESIGALTVEAEKYRERAQFMTQMNDDLKNGLLDSIVAGKDFGEVLGNLARQLARAALEAALFGSGPFSRGGGGGGGILGALGGALFGGFRAGGGPVQAGKAYVVGERQPEMFVPGQSGTIVPSVPTLTKAGAGGSASIVVQLSPGLEAAILQKAQGQAIQIVQASAMGQQRAFGSTISSLNARGTS